MRKLLVALASFGVLGIVSITARQESGSPVGDMSLNAVEPAVNLLSRKLKFSHFVANTGMAPVAGGFQPIHPPLTITCPGTGTCTFEAHQNVQMRANSSTGSWAVCTRVDGNDMHNPTCPNLGNPPAGAIDVRSFVQTTSGLGPGAHTVQSFIFTGGGGERGAYEITYRVLKP
jgi:hypothetical protein